ncbi:glutamine-hydrolyzing GMP synthase [Gammaproteobacteria bacterium]|nr:glutamine-hydrolyzing GMP synthase [Gammaproteobacteria bacterium]
MEKILVIDFGSQYTQLIARRLRELSVYSEVCPWDEIPDLSEVKGFILSGGPESSNIEGNPSIDQHIFDTKKPILGICYGMQVLAYQEEGRIINEGKREFGYAKIDIKQDSILFKNLDKSSDVWMSHGDKVESLPDGYKITAVSNNSPVAAYENIVKKYFGLQFHPEVTHTESGITIIKNFLEICDIKQNWSSYDILQQINALIKTEVKDEEVLLALSGGVDSTVLAAVLHKSLGNKLTCVMVDHGLLRKDEALNVVNNLKEKIGLSVNLVNAQDTFLSKLKGIKDPEVKRKIIGNTFIEVFESESKKLNDINWLAQGTIYPDVIESAGNSKTKAKVIKSHHNVGGLPERMQLKLLEPFRMLFKDEVRKLGKTIGLPTEIVERHPFPGPGLGIRIIGEVNKDRLDKLREADHIFLSELKKQNLYYSASQAYAFYLPVKSVGVVGDNRIYADVIGLRSVNTTDFMTATATALPHNFVEYVSTRIVNEIDGISRVVYDITSKPPATIEWE